MTEPAALMAVAPLWPHKVEYVCGKGYVVWRDVFEGGMRCSLADAIATHAVASFVFGEDARAFCAAKNSPAATQGEPIVDSRCEYLYWSSGRCDKCGNVHDGKLPGVTG